MFTPSRKYSAKIFFNFSISFPDILKDAPMAPDSGVPKNHLYQISECQYAMLFFPQSLREMKFIIYRIFALASQEALERYPLLKKSIYRNSLISLKESQNRYGRMETGLFCLTPETISFFLIILPGKFQEI